MRVFLRLLKLLGISILIFLIGALALLVKTYVVWGTHTKNDPVLPAITAQTISEWEAQKPEIVQYFEDYVFGNFPVIDTTDWRIETEVLDESAGNIEQIKITDPEQGIVLRLILVLPQDAGESTPLLLTSNFCGNHSAFAMDGVAKPSVPYPPFCDMEDMPWLAEVVFGDRINSFPVEDVLQAGYAFGAFYPGEIVPDEENLAPHYLQLLSSMSETKATGAISAWAWGYSLILDKLESDTRLDLDDVAIYGHSRNGKAALWAAANDPRIGRIVAHQSGTGGATLNQSHHGESIRTMTNQYPHWFDPVFGTFHNREKELPIDQHHLLALLAPRPLLLGNAMLDKWSDPKGAFRAARAAAEIYDLYEAGSFTAQNLKDFHPKDRLSFWTRGAPHGVRSSDWEAFLEFLNKH